MAGGIKIDDPEFIEQQKKELRKISDVMNVEEVYEHIDEFEETTGTPEGARDVFAAAELSRMLKNKSEADKLKTVGDVLGRLMRGEKVFTGQFGLDKVAMLDFDDRYEYVSEYLCELLKIGQRYGTTMDRYPLNGLGTGLVSVENFEGVKNSVKDAFYAPDAKQNGNIALMNFALFQKVYAELDDPFSNISNKIDGYEVRYTKEAMYLRGVDVLKELSQKHFSREKPGFFARLFRTENARKYAYESECMTKIKNELADIKDRDNFAFPTEDEGFTSMPIDLDKLTTRETCAQESRKVGEFRKYVSETFDLGVERDIFGEYDYVVGDNTKKEAVALPEEDSFEYETESLDYDEANEQREFGDMVKNDSNKNSILDDDDREITTNSNGVVIIEGDEKEKDF